MANPVECVGIVCLKGEDVLLIRRGKPPREGQWSIPGGRIELGETEQQACLRELMEETGISALIVEKIERLTTDFGQGPYHLHDYLALWESGEPVAGDDAAAAMFMPLSQIDSMNMWDETVRIIRKGRAMMDSNKTCNSDKTC